MCGHMFTVFEVFLFPLECLTCLVSWASQGWFNQITGSNRSMSTLIVRSRTMYQLAAPTRPAVVMGSSVARLRSMHTLACGTIVTVVIDGDLARHVHHNHHVLTQEVLPSYVVPSASRKDFVFVWAEAQPISSQHRVVEGS